MAARPVLVIVATPFNFLPKVISWPARSRIFRRCGVLRPRERDVESRAGALPIDGRPGDLDRIEHVAGQFWMRTRFRSCFHKLREHVRLVRRAIVAMARRQRYARP